jgi:hypothetical protein
MRTLIGWMMSGLMGTALLAGCQHDATPGAAAQAPVAGVQLGLYRVVLKTPGGELPFGMSLEAADGGTVAYLINGPERLKVSEVKIDGSHLDIMMPGYENHLTAVASGGTLTGEIELSKLNGNDQHVPLVATLGTQYRFYASASTDNADVGGRWALTFVDEAGVKEEDVGEFTQSHDAVTGTILTPTGDHRYLAGQVHGDELDLSTARTCFSTRPSSAATARCRATGGRA